MSALPRAIQGVILFSTLFGIVFLFEVYPVLPTAAFELVTFGWVLFVVDSVLTFARPRVAFYLGLILAALALAATWTQPAHYQLIASGDVAATATIVVGTIDEVLLIVLVAYFAVTQRGKDPWAWPSSKTQA